MKHDPFTLCVALDTTGTLAVNCTSTMEKRMRMSAGTWYGAGSLRRQRGRAVHFASVDLTAGGETGVSVYDPQNEFAVDQRQGLLVGPGDRRVHGRLTIRQGGMYSIRYSSL